MSHTGSNNYSDSIPLFLCWKTRHYIEGGISCINSAPLFPTPPPNLILVTAFRRKGALRTSSKRAYKVEKALDK